jgi:PIN domain nuclease of toxin-antitoxin system
MRYVLDTHTFLWLSSSSSKLSAKVFAICKDVDNQLLLSIASVWELQIKIQLAKITLSDPLADVVKTQQAKNTIQLLSIELPHVLELAKLPDHHKDPFDRLLVAQARIEQAVLLSNDPQIKRYPVTVVW